MSQEDEISSDIYRFPKKQRPKKVPQRGLGVVQLEKIRIEEQQKKDSSSNHNHKSSSASASASASAASSSSASCFALPMPTFVPSNRSCSSLPGIGNANEYNNIERESSGLDPGLAFRPNMSWPCESEPIWPLPRFMQRAQRPLMQVNFPSRTSATSVLNFQMEHPSKQGYYGNCRPLLADDDKAVGMKRSYPFSLDNAPGPPIYTKYPPINEPASTSNATTFNFNEVPSCSTSNMESKSKKTIKQNGVFDGDFLTLAPPTMCSTSKFKHPSSILTYYNGELPNLESLPYQASFEDPVIRRGVGGFNQSYQPYYSFLPPAMVQIDRTSTISVTNCKGGEVGHVDLDLKL